MGFGAKLGLIFLLALPAGVFAGVSLDTEQTHNSPGLLKFDNDVLKEDAFGSDRSFGVVSLTSDVYIVKVDVGESTTIVGAVKAMGKDDGYIEDAQETLDQSNQRIFQSFNQSGNFLLVPEQKILVTPDYEGRKADKRNYLNPTSRSLHTAEGYKLFYKKGSLKKLARELNLDAAVHVNVRYGFTSKVFGVVGYAVKGSYYGTVTVEVLAVNPKGKVIWKDSAYSVSQKPVENSSTWGETANFTILKPLLPALAADAIENLLATLDEQLKEKAATAANSR
jgi:hypothetical protein